MGQSKCPGLPAQWLALPRALGWSWSPFLDHEAAWAQQSKKEEKGERKRMKGERHCSFKAACPLGRVCLVCAWCNLACSFRYRGTRWSVEPPGSGRVTPLGPAGTCGSGVSQLHFPREQLRTEETRNDLLKYRVWGPSFLLAGFTTCWWQLVQSVIRRVLKSLRTCVPCGRIHSRTHGCK
jgi:hypothetical protein